MRERGPLRRRELHRLAIGTITELAAIHRAGVVHRDFKRQARVPLLTGTVLWGWFNEDHLLVYGDGMVDVLDGAGRPVRRLAELETGDRGFWEVRFTRAW